ncbi:MAG TPA: hypothetical protein PLF88_07045 [Opitutaceae bacterium]|nr:hypothetical protein [Opitutaceae bacterium]HRJ46758.1 hypothetical protein [Opitutaceae bacterium]
MSSLVRNLLALLAGALTAIACIGLIQVLAHLAYPPPPGLDLQDPAVRATIMMSAPAGALLLVLLSYVTGTFAGAWIAARLSADAAARQGYMIGGMMLISGFMNLTAIPHPPWFWAASITGFVVAAYLGARQGAKRPPASPA